MQIKQELLQFNEQSALLIVSGRQHAVFYLANKGEINKKAEVKVEIKVYSDRESHFERRSGGKFLGSGSVYEDKTKEERKKEFLDKIEKVVKKYQNTPLVYCFCPIYLQKKLEANLSKIVKMNKIFTGNYTDEHPFELLKKIQDSQKMIKIKI